MFFGTQALEERKRESVVLVFAKYFSKKNNDIPDTLQRSLMQSPESRTRPRPLGFGSMFYLASFSLGVPWAVHAEDDATKPPQDLPRVVVTASSMSAIATSLQDTPQNVT